MMTIIIIINNNGITADRAPSLPCSLCGPLRASPRASLIFSRCSFRPSVRACISACVPACVCACVRASLRPSICLSFSSAHGHKKHADPSPHDGRPPWLGARRRNAPFSSGTWSTPRTDSYSNAEMKQNRK